MPSVGNEPSERINFVLNVEVVVGGGIKRETNVLRLQVGVVHIIVTGYEDIVAADAFRAFLREVKRDAIGHEEGIVGGVTKRFHEVPVTPLITFPVLGVDSRTSHRVANRIEHLVANLVYKLVTILRTFDRTAFGRKRNIVDETVLSHHDAVDDEQLLSGLKHVLVENLRV